MWPPDTSLGVLKLESKNVNVLNPRLTLTSSDLVNSNCSLDGSLFLLILAVVCFGAKKILETLICLLFQLIYNQTLTAQQLLLAQTNISK